MVIESTPAVAKLSIQEVFSFLRDVSNLYHLLPLDKIKDWEASTEHCSFKVQGGSLFLWNFFQKIILINWF